jgi:hypothetical protein
MHMEPAKSILDRIGVDKASEVTQKHKSRIYRWMYPAGARGGTGGIIPHTDALKLLDYSRENNLGLTEADFLRKPTPAEGRGAA